jgi:hypothetical protein
MSAKRMKRQPSPVKLVCKRVKLGPNVYKICRWTCPRGGATVMFRAKWQKDLYAILHPSTKQRGKWQVTRFDDRGPIGDVIRSTCEQALADMDIDGNWVIDKTQNVFRGLGRR